MALLESATVVYMRRLYYSENPLEVFPLKFLDSFDTVLELSREAATVVMIVTVAMLAERSSRTRSFAAFAFVFGVWDLFYYVWLKVLMGWPQFWLEWDVLFLIPSVWLGPWISPALIALLFIGWGFYTLRSTASIYFTPNSFTVFVAGAGLGLASFLQPAMAVLMGGGMAQLSQYTPGDFWWGLFVAGYVLMACGLGMTLRGANKVPTVPAAKDAIA
jgi:hypothetical protein